MARASQDQLDSLRWVLLEHLLYKLKNPPAERLKSSFLAVAIKFLGQSSVVRPSEDETMDRSALIEKLAS